MARIYDNEDHLVGGYSPAIPPTRLNPKYGQEEMILGLECSYGAFGYCYSRLPNDRRSANVRWMGCHNPVEASDERHHCDACGGDYCTLHAEPAAHDCEYVLRHR